MANARNFSFRISLRWPIYIVQLIKPNDLDTSFITSKKVHPGQPEIKVHLEIHFNLRSVLLDFQSFAKNTFFERPFAHPYYFCHTWLKTVFIASLLYAN